MFYKLDINLRFSGEFKLFYYVAKFQNVVSNMIVERRSRSYITHFQRLLFIPTYFDIQI